MKNKIFIITLFSIILTSSGLAARPDIVVKFDGRVPFSGDPISAAPVLEVFITSTITVDAFLSFRSQTPLRKPLDLVKTGATAYYSREALAPLSDGLYIFTVEAFGPGTAATFEVGPLFVQNNSSLILQGPPLAFPNPYDPTGGALAIGYTLSKPANITLNIFDLAGNLINRQSFPAGINGGLAGYNEVSWDGKTLSGATIGNGVYILVIAADGQVPPNGKGRITVFR